MRSRALLPVLVVGLLALSGTAQAATYCVMKPACAGTAKNSVQDALDAALASGQDRIEIGPTVGLVPPAGGSYLSSDPLEIVGAGSASTQLGGANTVLSLGVGSSSSAVTVSDLTIAAQSSTGPPALQLNGAKAERVNVTTDSGAAGLTGVELRNGAAYRHGVIRLSATGSTAVAARLGTNSMDDVLIDLGYSSGATGLAVGNSTGETPIILDARQITIAGRGLSDQRGVLAAADSTGQTAVLNLSGVVVSLVAHSLQRSASNGTANINLDHSNYDPAAIVDTGGPGGIATSATNSSVDPSFVDALAGDFRLRPRSPLIDAGRADGLAAGEPSTDLGGSIRIVDGNRDCSFRRDIGAFEFVPSSASAFARATPASASIGQQITFDASGSCDPDPAAHVSSYSWSFDDGSTAPGAVVQHAFARPGAHTAALSITSSTGRGDGAAVTVTISAPARPTSGAPRRRARPRPRSLVLIAARAVTLARGAASIALKCSGALRCTGRLELYTARPVSLAARRRVLKLGSTRFSIRPYGRKKVAVRLSRRGLALVRTLERLSVNVTVRDRDSAGRPRESIRRVTLRAPASNRHELP